jgi:hypothetical protein
MVTGAAMAAVMVTGAAVTSMLVAGAAVTAVMSPGGTAVAVMDVHGADCLDMPARSGAAAEDPFVRSTPAMAARMPRKIARETSRRAASSAKMPLA